MPDISYHRYTLRSRGSLNAVSQRREFHGALIKVDDGIGCLHPWPEFGDAPTDDQLNLLREGGTSKVIERALRMAAVDGEARRRGVSLFEGIEIPRSHFSFDQNQSVEAQMQRVFSEGWRAIKTKGSANVDETNAFLDSLLTSASKERHLPSAVHNTDGTCQVPLLDEPVRFRIDFNSCLSAAEFAEFMNRLPAASRERLDFIEDPFPYDAAAWSHAKHQSEVKLACDKGLSSSSENDPDECGYDFAVLKPGRRDWRATLARIPKHTRIVMTSAMDHAIGQAFAAWEAAMAWRELGGRLDLCGLCTEHLFEKDAFFERIHSRGGLLEVDRLGAGLGFDDVLASIEWQAL